MVRWLTPTAWVAVMTVESEESDRILIKSKVKIIDDFNDFPTQCPLWLGSGGGRTCWISQQSEPAPSCTTLSGGSWWWRREARGGWQVGRPVRGWSRCWRGCTSVWREHPPSPDKDKSMCVRNIHICHKCIYYIYQSSSRGFWVDEHSLMVDQCVAWQEKQQVERKPTE